MELTFYGTSFGKLDKITGQNVLHFRKHKNLFECSLFYCLYMINEELLLWTNYSMVHLHGRFRQNSTPFTSLRMTCFELFAFVAVS